MSIATHLGFQLPKPVQRWMKPPRDSIKINVDAAFKDGNSSIAVVARDWRGEVVFACAKRVYSNLPIHAEAKAIKWALCLAKNLEAAAMIVESVSKDCVDALAPSGKLVPWRIRGICSEILNLILLIPGCHVSWIPRVANKAAHSLAKWSFLNKVFGSFDVGFGPPCFESIIMDEALVSSL
ncbi:uncharacterized protein LOC142605940 [Castanea sativa]|uniref:uncharacterized protein LOC142605940 n=1 Tax=Castanea sativa TaxID=21020 RepID=UPI003F64F069